jgi:hypothetical protein
MKGMSTFWATISVLVITVGLALILSFLLNLCIFKKEGHTSCEYLCKLVGKQYWHEYALSNECSCWNEECTTFTDYGKNYTYCTKIDEQLFRRVD